MARSLSRLHVNFTNMCLFLVSSLGTEYIGFSYSTEDGPLWGD